jgi:glycosyltransferase involved in cell wall biosynthesis
MPHYLLDLSRLITSAGRPAPTGIDRVELAYAREMLARPPEAASFGAMTDWLRFGPLERAQVAEFIQALTAAWGEGGEPGRARSIAASLCRHIWLRGEAALHARLRRATGRVIYLNVSHHHLHRPGSIARMKQHGAYFAALLHDVLPIEFPEYVRPNQDDVHRRRVATLGALADVLMASSEVTARSLRAKLGARQPKMIVTPLGFDLTAPSPGPAPAIPEPYFVCVGTIEPRKNHLLLLTVWRRLAAELGAELPHLVLVGRRGWENEMVVDLLERCPALAGKVHEFDTLADAPMRSLIAGSRALLMPSWGEGYGLPIIEALALGAPVLCSDLPVFREVGGDVPEYLDPIDGAAWCRAIRDFAPADSPRRAAQLARLAGWRVPEWRDHFALVDEFLNSLETG